MVNGCHVLDRMLCWFGAPASVVYSDDAHGGVEANCSARLRSSRRASKES